MEEIFANENGVPIEVLTLIADSPKDSRTWPATVRVKGGHPSIRRPTFYH
jgi:hypothetical protein